MGRNVGEKLSNGIDAEIRRIVERALLEARRLLRDNRASLERIAEALIEREILEGPELEALLADARRAHEERAGNGSEQRDGRLAGLRPSQATIG